MQHKKLLAHAVAVGVLVAAAAASHAATLVTFNPQSNNGGLGVIDAATTSFQSTGATAQLVSNLQINGTSGISTFSETGTITINDFDGVLQSVSNVNTNYSIFGNFSISGFGQWSGNTFFASSTGLVFTGSLFADPTGGGYNPFLLGTFSIDPNEFSLAFATAVGPVVGALAPGVSGSGITTLFATLDYSPNVGTTGVGGFFEAPFPLSLQIAIGNAGGNTLNTSYTVNSDGSLVSFITPGTQPDAGPGSADLTFITTPVPEPGVLSLVGIAMLGLAISRKRLVK